MHEFEKILERKDKRDVVVLGAGPCGLAAGYRLADRGFRPIVLEKEPRVGGLSATIRIKDYELDYGPHTFHLKPTVITELFERKIGDKTIKTTRKVRLQIAGKNLGYPLKPTEALLRFNPFLSARIVLSFLRTKLFQRRIDPDESFEAYGISNFGKTLYRLAFGDYSEKVWGQEGSALSAKLGRQKLQSLDFKKLFLSALNLLKRDTARELGIDRNATYDAYPEQGIGVFYEKLADDINRMGGDVILGAEPVRMEFDGDKIAGLTYTLDGEEHTISCDAVISSIPLTTLVGILAEDQGSAIRESIGWLKYRGLIEIHLILDKNYFSNAHWIYLVDSRFRTSRLSEQKNLNARSCPPGQTIVSFDLPCEKGDYMWNAQDAFLINIAMDDLKALGVQPRTIIDGFVVRVENVYPVYLRGFEKQVNGIVEQLSRYGNLYSTGRQGLYLNNDMHDSMEMGFLAADALVSNQHPREWYDTIINGYVRERLEGVRKDPVDFEPKD